MSALVNQVLYQFAPLFIFAALCFFVLWRLAEHKANKYHEDCLSLAYELNKMTAEAAYYQSVCDKKLAKDNHKSGPLWEGVKVAA